MEREHLFVVGSPRSGTTWLQLLLAQHEQIATGKETQLFAQYVSRLRERWAEEQREARAGTTNGLTRVLDEAEFDKAIRCFCDSVFASVSRENAAATFILEKSPEHSLHAESILRVYPNAWFLHIIRDPRAVASSFRHAAASWWAAAPAGPVETTLRWRKNVIAGRAIATVTQRYKEVRYEDLLEDGEDVLLNLFAWLGLEADAEFCRAAVAACEIGNLRGPAKDVVQPWSLEQEPDGFFRSGQKDGWSEDLSAIDVAVIERKAGSLMVELGYRPTSLARRRYRALLWANMHGVLSHIYAGGRNLSHRIDWRLRRLLSRL